jgi:hypothetical protein
MKVAYLLAALLALNWIICRTSGYNPFYCLCVRPIADFLIVCGMGLFAYGLWFKRSAILPGLLLAASATELTLTVTGGGSCH